MSDSDSNTPSPSRGASDSSDESVIPAAGLADPSLVALAGPGERYDWSDSNISGPPSSVPSSNDESRDGNTPNSASSRIGISPSYNPTSPSYNPTSPSYSPTWAREALEEPENPVSPDENALRRAGLVGIQASPEYSPNSPVNQAGQEHPASPEYSPNSPLYDPNIPLENGQGNVRPDQPGPPEIDPREPEIDPREPEIPYQAPEYRQPLQAQAGFISYSPVVPSAPSPLPASPQSPSSPGPVAAVPGPIVQSFANRGFILSGQLRTLSEQIEHQRANLTTNLTQLNIDFENLQHMERRIETTTYRLDRDMRERNHFQWRLDRLLSDFHHNILGNLGNSVGLRVTDGHPSVLSADAWRQEENVLTTRIRTLRSDIHRGRMVLVGFLRGRDRTLENIRELRDQYMDMARMLDADTRTQWRLERQLEEWHDGMVGGYQARARDIFGDQSLRDNHGNRRGYNRN